MGEQNGSSKARWGFEKRGRKLMKLHLEDDLVDSTPALFADPDSTHQRCKRLVSRGWRAVQEALGGDQRLSRIRDLDSIVKDLYCRAGASDGEVLMDQSIGHELSNGQLRKHRYRFPKSLANDLVHGQEAVDESHQPFKAIGIALGAELLAQSFRAAFTSVLNNTNRLPLKRREFL